MRALLRAVLLLLSLPLLADSPSFLAVSASSGQSEKNEHGQADLQALHVEIGKAISPRTEVAMVIEPMQVSQPRSWFGDTFGDGNETVRAISAAALVRHRLNGDSSRAHVYGEASIGPMWADKPIPASTSRFNFATSFGLGLVLMPRGRYPLLVGYRFEHLSNGGYSPRNPGFNMSMFVVGLQLRR